MVSVCRCLLPLYPAAAAWQILCCPWHGRSHPEVILTAGMQRDFMQLLAACWRPDTFGSFMWHVDMAYLFSSCINLQT